MINRTSGVAAMWAALLLVAPACKHQRIRSADTIEEPPKLVSTIRMGDPAVAGQLISGFYTIEANAWRWTARQFSVNLRRPANILQRGAVLELHLTIPAANIQQLGSQTVSATVAGAELPSETYSKPGEYSYRRYVQPSWLGTDPVRVDFQVDKAIPPGEADKRELGIVVLSVGLVAR